MKIFTIADKKEEKFLRTKTANFDFSKHPKNEMDEIIKKMREIMIKARGIGLSANQVGLNLRLFVVHIPQINADGIRVNPLLQKNNPRLSASNKFYVIFNPKIKVSAFSRKKTEMEEGCLSVPGVYGMVKRYEKITLTGQDINGRKIKIKAQGLLARVFQHETDHLNGILFIDKCKNVYAIEKS